MTVACSAANQGAGDRLGLVDTETGEALPAAMLQYCGRMMLDGLIRDVQVSSCDNLCGVRHWPS